MKPIFIDKLFKNISPQEKKELITPFICLHSTDQSGLPYFQYLIVDLKRADEFQFIARFNDITIENEYVKWLLQK